MCQIECESALTHDANQLWISDEGSMQTIAVGNRTLSLPTLVPSISSFETQLSPIEALTLQHQLREPVSLVSAYDLRRQKDGFTDLCKEYKKTAVLLLDSGGYEDSRIRRYAGIESPSWSFAEFQSICELKIYDFAFSYDFYWRDEQNSSESASDFELRLVGEVFGSHHFIPADQLIPVVHLHAWHDQSVRLDESQIRSLVSRIASECKSPFLAIPERELGDGLVERARLTKLICEEISKASKDFVGLHILGCGNPLTFAFLLVAGARMADGLEWYRTFAADDFHLHHFQHRPVFEGACSVYNPVAEWILANDLPYSVKAATSNLLSFQTFAAELTPRLQTKTVNELVSESFGRKAGAALQSLEQ